MLNMSSLPIRHIFLYLMGIILWVQQQDIRPWLTDEEISRILGDRIRERRLLRNITQEELAHETGVTKLTIQKIEQ